MYNAATILCWGGLAIYLQEIVNKFRQELKIHCWEGLVIYLQVIGFQAKRRYKIPGALDMVVISFPKLGAFYNRNFWRNEQMSYLQYKQFYTSTLFALP